MCQSMLSASDSPFYCTSSHFLLLKPLRDCALCHSLDVCLCVQKYVIVLEEEVIPTQDFLELMARCLPAIEADDTLVGVSAWNVNGLYCSDTDTPSYIDTDTPLVIHQNVIQLLISSLP